jgi:hypothetical protein
MDVTSTGTGSAFGWAVLPDHYLVISSFYPQKKTKKRGWVGGS